MNTKSHILLCLSVILAALLPESVSYAAEQVSVTSEYASRHYTTQDGLPQMLAAWADMPSLTVYE